MKKTLCLLMWLSVLLVQPISYAATISVDLNMVSGDVAMIDHSLVYMFGFSESGQVGFPGPTILCQEGDTVDVTLNNTLDTDSSFKVGGTSIYKTVSAGNNTSISFSAPASGSYIYYDDLNDGVNRVMGLHGALIVMPSGITDRSFSGGPTFVRQYKWMLGNVDPVWGEAVRNNGDDYVTNNSLGVDTFKPRYFTINGQSYEDTQRRVPDISRMRDILGVEPTVPLEEGLRITYDWFHAQHNLKDDRPRAMA